MPLPGICAGGSLRFGLLVTAGGWCAGANRPVSGPVLFLTAPATIADKVANAQEVGRTPAGPALRGGLFVRFLPGLPAPGLRLGLPHPDRDA